MTVVMMMTVATMIIATMMAMMRMGMRIVLVLRMSHHPGGLMHEDEDEL